MSSPVPSMMSEDVRRGPAALAGQARQMPALQPYASLWKGGLGGDAPRWLAGHGWQPQSDDLAAVRKPPRAHLFPWLACPDELSVVSRGRS